MKKILTFIITIFLSLSFQVHSIEIEIITDKPGTGKKIIRHSWVQLEYTGSFENGKVFDTNIGKDRPLVVQMSMKEVIPGFEQGIIGTTKGTKRKIKIPAELAYGEKGGGDIIPPNTDLIFEFEVIDVLDPLVVPIIPCSKPGITSFMLICTTKGLSLPILVSKTFPFSNEPVYSS